MHEDSSKNEDIPVLVYFSVTVMTTDFTKYVPKVSIPGTNLVCIYRNVSETG